MMKLGKSLRVVFFSANLFFGLMPFGPRSLGAEPSTLWEEEAQYERENPLQPHEYVHEQKAAERYDPNANYAQPNLPSPSMAHLLDKIFATYQTKADLNHDRRYYQAWVKRLQEVMKRFDADPSRYVEMQLDMLNGNRTKACNYTVFVVHEALRYPGWLEKDQNYTVSVPARAAEFDNRTKLDRANPRSIRNVFNGVPLVGAANSNMRFLRVEFLDHLIATMNHYHLNFLPTYFVVNREPLRRGRPGHVFFITGIKRTGKTTGWGSFTLQLREGSLNESYWRARPAITVDKFINSSPKLNILVPTQAFAELYLDDMETRFVIRENERLRREREREQNGSQSDSGSSANQDYTKWFMPIAG